MALVLLAALYPVVFLMTWVSNPDVIHTGLQVRRHSLAALKITVDCGFRAGLKSLAAWVVLAAAFKTWDTSSEVWSLVPLALAGAIFSELFRIWDKPSYATISGPLRQSPNLRQK